MAISDNYVPIKQLGNGSTVDFTGDWNVLVASYIRVYLENVSTGVQTLQTLDSDFSLVFSPSGFTATFFVAPTNANYVVIGREVDLNQTDPYTTSRGYQGPVLEASLDKLTAVDQDQQDKIDRSLKFKLGSASVGELVEPQDDCVIAWSGSTGATKNGPTTASIAAGSTAAAASAAAAAASAAAAAASESAAGVSASDAADSAAAALTSEGNASTSASTASTQATLAASYASATLGLKYNYLTATTNSDPSAGNLKFNNATLASATALYISETSALAQDVAAEIATWDDSTSTIHGKLKMVKLSDPAVFAIFNVTGTLTDNGGWDTITVAYVTGSGSFANTDAVALQYLRTGDKGDTGATGTSGVSIPGGRLTLTTGVPVTTGDVTGASTLYYTPYVHNKIALYTGGVWTDYTFTERSLALSGLTSGRPYDVFVYDNAGTVTLDLTAWTNDTTRATALAYQDGVLVKSGSPAYRYLGTIYTTGTTTTEDSAANRLVWNYYNRVDRALAIQENGSASHNYTTATWRNMNNSASNAVKILRGVAEDAVRLTAQAFVQNTSAGVAFATGIGVDSSTVNSAQIAASVTPAANVGTIAMAEYVGCPSAGLHTYNWLQYSAATGTATWFTFSGIFVSGMVGSVQG